ncbi:acrosin-like [Leptodactylus fuscus]
MKLQVLIHVTTILLWHFMDHGTGFPISPTTHTCGNRPMVTYDVGSRIVGGKDSQPGSWPWMVSLQEHIDEDIYGHMCGGTVLSTQWILTAAHCFKGQADAYYSWRLVIGAHKLSVSGRNIEIRKIAKKIEHEQYNPETERNDIALLLVDRPISYNQYIQPACLPKKTADVTIMTDCFITGWGVLHESDSETSDTLQEARVEMLNTMRCNSTYWYNGAVGIYNLCAGFAKGGIDTCQGDSGGPLNCREPRTKTFSVVGITSWGSGCGQFQSPGIYTSTHYFLNWIQDKMDSNTPGKKPVA